MNKDMDILNGRCSCDCSTSYIELERYWNCFMAIILGILTFYYSNFRKQLKILKVWSNKREYPVFFFLNKGEDTHWLLWVCIDSIFPRCQLIGLYLAKKSAQGAFVLDGWEHLFFCIILHLLFWNTSSILGRIYLDNTFCCIIPSAMSLGIWHDCLYGWTWIG